MNRTDFVVAQNCQKTVSKVKDSYSSHFLLIIIIVIIIIIIIIIII